ncbi:RNA polymerase sigma-70 factor [Flagellimonas pacifica]|uniref:RNA polymerase sigma-70 factor, ECF subfamily n=1 Tax=Flagellimonas pacifica TaxID=1247520 RepID=A0A285MRQ6_9FLAO|nr:RNA polymerase sigma-70 factor [Allomuricauda parva]SNY99373.1 RNA polymerase sigma-70 factor, ECF subfamily [Allomuricauda parva]
MGNDLNIKKSTLFQLVKKGDKEAYRLLYDLYYPKLLQIAIGYIPKNEDAEELVQDVFLKVWKKRYTININSNMDGYLYRMMRNACLDFLRSKKHTLNAGGNIAQLEAALNLQALSNDAASAILVKELEQQIMEAIELLPDKCKAVFLKSKIEGLKNREISEELQISHKTVEGHITKAIKHLQLHLKEFLYFFQFIFLFIQG